MKARAIIVVILFAACVPAPGSAQGFMDLSGSALPFFQVEPTLYTGYLFQNKGVSMTIGGKPGGSAGAPSFRQDYDLRGLWLEAMVPVKSSGIMGLAFGGAYFVPFAVTSTENYGVDAGGALIQRSWQTATQWFNLQAATTFDLTPAVTAIAGFRYDSFMTNFKEPEATVNTIGGPFDLGDFTFAGYIPFVGVVLNNRGYLGPAVKLDAGLVGMPIIFGSLQYREKVGQRVATGTIATTTYYGQAFPGVPMYGTTVYGIPAYNEFKKGHFYEAFVNCSFAVGAVTIGGFGRFTSVYGSTTANLSERSEIGLLRSVGGTVDYDSYPEANLAFEFQRRSWVVGGKVSMDF